MLAKTSGKFCVGGQPLQSVRLYHLTNAPIRTLDEFTLADACLVPQVFNAQKFGVDLTPYPTILRLNATILDVDAVKKAHPSAGRRRRRWGRLAVNWKVLWPFGERRAAWAAVAPEGYAPGCRLEIGGTVAIRELFGFPTSTAHSWLTQTKFVTLCELASQVPSGVRSEGCRGWVSAQSRREAIASGKEKEKKLTALSPTIRIVLHYKGIDFKSVPVNLDAGEVTCCAFGPLPPQLSPAHIARNPNGTVPAFSIDDNTTLMQSTAIMEYLEEVYPSPSMLPKDPILRVQTRAIIGQIACDIQPIQNRRVLEYAGDDRCEDWAKHFIELGFNGS
ncbi:hypothetical protein BDK51DRAFT_30557 [Blyttiomyces helicus]|uniref:GST N-terminal domain-containing protein n=1 Tax=Blyttiomyces helicus TaxID=388810 RepID=A0A4P9WAA2_9FUNG|nr:hypothetical protein BDK51DRAFT_30557 [Blyttiomyces helicus]|eukprot:RKO87780.1 hypothetical protein BDK51DRAFT_30557 [Blyttiomyces helicus]